MLSIPYVGKLRSKILEEKKYDLEKLKNASPEEIGKLMGFSDKIGERIIKYAKMVDKNYEIPDELIFEELRCPQCGAIVSEVEPVCHKCGHEFFTPPPNMDKVFKSIAEVIVGLYKNPKDATLWRKGEKLLNTLGDEKKASDFKFRASALELEGLETEEKESKVGISKISRILAASKSTREGKINGLVNGTGVPMRKKEPKRRVFRAVIVFLIVLIPVIFASYLTFGTSPPVAIDGNFGEWKNVHSFTLLSGFFKYFKMKNYDGYSYVYLRSSHLFSNRTEQYFSMMIDSDSNPNTGYPVNSLGVDFAVMIHGKYGDVVGDMWKYANGSWSKWGKVDVACNNNQMEMKMMRIGDDAKILLYYRDSEEHYSSVLTMKPKLWLMYQGGRVLSNGDEVENITLWNSNVGEITINKINVKNAGNATADVRISIGGFQKEVTISPKNTTVNFNSPLKISKPMVMHITYISGGSKFSTLKPVIYPDTPFSSVDISSGSYIGAIPNSKSIDGIFLDWQNAHESPKGKVPLNIDLKRYGDDTTGNVKIYLSVYGTLFGIGAPEIKIAGGNGTGGNETQNVSLPKDTIEIYVDSDKNPDTGFRIGNIGAEYKILLSGNLEKVEKREAFVWQSGRWVKKSMNIKDAKNSNSIEIGLNLKGNVYYRLVNFEGVWDHIHLNTFSVSRKSVRPRYIGTYNSTEFFTRFGNDVNITDGWTQNQTTPTITSNGSALFVAFDAGYSENGHNVCVGFAVSNDNGNTWDTYYFTNIWGEYPVIVSNGYGDVFIFFENHTSGSNFEYLVHYHSNGTNSDGSPIWITGSISDWNWWSSVYSISASGMGSDMAISFEYWYFDSSGNPEDSDIWVIYSEDTDSWENTWTVTGVATSNNYELWPSITITGGTSPYIYVAYEIKEYNSTGGFYYYDVFYNYTSVGSTSWSTGVRLTVSDGTEGLDNDLWPDISSSANYVFIAWEHDYYNPNNWDLETTNLWIANISASSGSVLSTYKLTTDSANLEQSPSIWVNGNSIYVAYYNATSSGEYVYLLTSNDGDHTWSAPEQISDDGQVNSTIPAIDVYYNNGYLYIVWSDDSPGSVNKEYADIFFDEQAIPEFPNPYISFMLILLGISLAMRRRTSRNHAEK